MYMFNCMQFNMYVCMCVYILFEEKKICDIAQLNTGVLQYVVRTKLSV
jgi:hypothetical protein